MDEKKSLWIDEMLLDIDEGLCERTWVCYLYNVLYAIVIILSVEVRVGVCSGLDVRHDLIRQLGSIVLLQPWAAFKERWITCYFTPAFVILERRASNIRPKRNREGKQC